MTLRIPHLTQVLLLSGVGILAGLVAAPACSGKTDDDTGGQSGSSGSSAGSGGNGNGGDAGKGAGGSGGSSGSSGSDGKGGDNTGGLGGSNEGGSAGSAAGGSAGNGSSTQCTNGIDDDGDGQIDGMDAECTGPLDDDESSFATGIPGDNKDPKWQDCFFDGNSGAGDDGCRYSTDCLTGELDSTDPKCEVTEQCLENCRGRTPNGCDCFGCCEIQLEDGSSVNVVLVGTCSLEKAEDEAACPRCVQDDDCDNSCGRCELCPGKTDLPDDCTGDPDAGVGGAGGAGGSGGNGGNGGNGGSGGDGHTCDDGEVVCDSAADCPSGSFCALGCCLQVS